MKSVNRYTSNEFHDWQRKNLPGRFVLQDIDTWALAWSDSQNNYEPIAIVELKRSYITPEKWTPFQADKPNYLALHKLAKRADLPLWIVYFQKDQSILDSSIFHLFDVGDVSEDGSGSWITYVDKLISAADFKDLFPNLF